MDRTNPENWIENEKYYHKRARMLSNLVTDVSDQYDILHDIYVETLSSGCTWQKAFNKVKSEIVKYQGLKGCEIKHKFSRYGVPNFNKKACKYFDRVNDILIRCGYQTGHHAMNGGEKKIGPYYVDFYIPGYNIIVEYNESHHYYTENVKADTKRRRFLERLTDMPIIIIHENVEKETFCARQIINSIEYRLEKDKYKTSM